MSAAWVQEKILGSGGFGSVILWRNKETNKQIAIKQCRLLVDTSTASWATCRDRWRMEVQIMEKLDHPNVVKAFPIPDELRVSPTEMPSLAMEYCSLGDLRQVLNKPENCCGLTEQQVRVVLQNVSSAVEYLHSSRIIHRDLKPENIVLSDVNGRIVYKLIDLGYAKELDQGSLCTSFVGTVQYLAPELFLSQQYSSTVDFWSLGLLTHECVTGSRPFLPNMTPAQWMPAVCKKKSHHICVHVSPSGDICYSEKICKENYLSKVFLGDIECWLQMMLEWDPGKRGTKIENGTKEIIAFNELNRILQKKVVEVFWVNSGLLNIYVIEDGMLLNDLYQQVSAHIGISETDLEFLLPRGLPPNTTDNALQNWNSLNDDNRLFVYPKRAVDQKDTFDTEIVPNVSDMMQNKNDLVTYEEQLEKWSHAVYFSKKECMCCKRFIQSRLTLMRNVVVCKSQLSSVCDACTVDMKNLEAVFNFYKKSVTFEKHQYEKQLESGSCLCCEKLSNFFNFDDITRSIEEQRTKSKKLEQKVNEISTKVVDLQRRQPMGEKMASNVEIFSQKIIELYGNRKKNKENRNQMHSNNEMVAALFEFLKEKQRLLTQCCSQIHMLMNYKDQISTTMMHLQNLTTEIADVVSKLEQLNRDRQDLIWRGIRHILKRSNSDGHSLPSVSNFHGSQSSACSSTLNSSACGNSCSPSVETHSSITDLRNSTLRTETLRENREILTRVCEASNSIASPAADLDWDSILSPQND